MSDKFGYFYRDLLSEEDKAKLTDEQKECFQLNDDIFRIHAEFNSRVSTAQNKFELADILAEHAGSIPGEIEGKFGDIITRLESIENDIAYFVLCEAFEQQQVEAERLFSKRYEEVVGPLPEKEWN